MIRTYNELKKNLKKDLKSFPAIKVALLGDTATQLLAVDQRQGFFPLNDSYNSRFI